METSFTLLSVSAPIPLPVPPGLALSQGCPQRPPGQAENTAEPLCGDM